MLKSHGPIENKKYYPLSLFSGNNENDCKDIYEKLNKCVRTNYDCGDLIVEYKKCLQYKKN